MTTAALIFFIGLGLLTQFTDSARAQADLALEPAAGSAPAARQSMEQNPFERFAAPVSSPSGQPEIHGTYAKGCAFGLSALSISTPSFELVNTKRNRYYAHPETIDLFQSIAHWASHESRIGKLIAGDFSQPAGGPMTTGHNSHQVGLDADIRFKFYPIGSTMSEKERQGYAEIDVAEFRVRKTDQGHQLVARMTGEWRQEYAALVAKFAAHPRVERIFASPPIKRELCKLYQPLGSAPYPAWLAKLRPNLGHTAHFHIRLRCPTQQPNCEPQEPVGVDPSDKTGVGCDGARLRYWFETDPKKDGYLRDTIASLKPAPGSGQPPAKPTPPPPPRWKTVLPQLPKACQQMVSDKIAPAASP